MGTGRVERGNVLGSATEKDKLPAQYPHSDRPSTGYFSFEECGIPVLFKPLRRDQVTPRTGGTDRLPDGAAVTGGTRALRASRSYVRHVNRVLDDSIAR
jgi:hypothetical protein